MPCEIRLTQGKMAIVDDEDYGMLRRYKWHFMPPRKGISGTGYASSGQHGTTRYMHRVIMLSPPKGLDVDHINGDGLDNRRENLRVIPHQQNCASRHRLNQRNSSGKAGVYFERGTGRWRAYIDNGRRIWLGRFTTKDEAIIARREAEMQEFKKTGKV